MVLQLTDMQICAGRAASYLLCRFRYDKTFSSRILSCITMTYICHMTQKLYRWTSYGLQHHKFLRDLASHTRTYTILQYWVAIMIILAVRLFVRRKFNFDRVPLRWWIPSYMRTHVTCIYIWTPLRSLISWPPSITWRSENNQRLWLMFLLKNALLWTVARINWVITAQSMDIVNTWHNKQFAELYLPPLSIVAYVRQSSALGRRTSEEFSAKGVHLRPAHQSGLRCPILPPLSAP